MATPLLNAHLNAPPASLAQLQQHMLQQRPMPSAMQQHALAATAQQMSPVALSSALHGAAGGPSVPSPLAQKQQAIKRPSEQEMLAEPVRKKQRKPASPMKRPVTYTDASGAPSQGSTATTMNGQHKQSANGSTSATPGSQQQKAAPTQTTNNHQPTSISSIFPAAASQPSAAAGASICGSMAPYGQMNMPLMRAQLENQCRAAFPASSQGGGACSTSSSMANSIPSTSQFLYLM